MSVRRNCPPPDETEQTNTSVLSNVNRPRRTRGCGRRRAIAVDKPGVCRPRTWPLGFEPGMKSQKLVTYSPRFARRFTVNGFTHSAHRFVSGHSLKSRSSRRKPGTSSCCKTELSCRRGCRKMGPGFRRDNRVGRTSNRPAKSGAFCCTIEIAPVAPHASSWLVRMTATSRPKRSWMKWTFDQGCTRAWRGI